MNRAAVSDRPPRVWPPEPELVTRYAIAFGTVVLAATDGQIGAVLRPPRLTGSSWSPSRFRRVPQSTHCEPLAIASATSRRHSAV